MLIEIVHAEQQRGKKMKKTEQSLRVVWGTTEHANIHITRVQGEERWGKN